MVRIRDMLVAFAIFGVVFVLASCGEPRQPTACEQERALVYAEQNAVDNPSIYFPSLVQDYSQYYEPVCVHGIPYFMENDQSYLDKRGHSQILVPLSKPHYEYATYFWYACKELERTKKPAPKGVADQGGAQ